MKCPSCAHADSKVIDSRHTENASIRRRRECIDCAHRFTTYEIIEVLPLTIIKKNGTRQEFDRNKIIGGLMKSCYRRPVDHTQITEIVAEIEMDLLNSLTSEIKSSEVGEMVMEKLRHIDDISYIRFASVYREFTDAQALRREIDELAD